MTALERADLSARRKQIYLRLHPETASVRDRGGPGRGKKTSPETGLVSTPSSIDATAAFTGRSRSQVAEDVYSVLASLAGAGHAASIDGALRVMQVRAPMRRGSMTWRYSRNTWPLPRHEPQMVLDLLRAIRSITTQNEWRTE